jgi:hypothetical protein
MGLDDEMGDAAGGRIDDEVRELAERPIGTCHGAIEIQSHG